MNSKAADVLRQAALDGVRQIKGFYSDGAGGRCAMGVLLYASRHYVSECRINTVPELRDEYGVDDKERTQIIQANDFDGRDFLEIASKFHDPLADVETL